MLPLREGCLGEIARQHNCTWPHLYGEAVQGVLVEEEGLLAASSHCLFRD
jgi:hypothetical protein